MILKFLIIAINLSFAVGDCSCSDKINESKLSQSDENYFKYFKILENFNRFRETHPDGQGSSVTDDKLVNIACYANVMDLPIEAAENELKNNGIKSPSMKSAHITIGIILKIKAKEIAYRVCNTKPVDDKKVSNAISEEPKIQNFRRLTNNLDSNDFITCLQYWLNVYDPNSKLLENFQPSFKYFEKKCDIWIGFFFQHDVYSALIDERKEIHDLKLENCNQDYFREAQIIFRLKLKIFELGDFSQDIIAAEIKQMEEDKNKKLREVIKCLLEIDIIEY